MKRAILLVGTLLTACTANNPASPLKPGESTTMQGKTKSGEDIALTYTINREKEFKRGLFTHESTYIKDGKPVLVDTGISKDIIIVTSIANESTTYLCFAFIHDSSWKKLDNGFLLNGSIDNMLDTLIEIVPSIKNEADGATKLSAKSGTCTITRS